MTKTYKMITGKIRSWVLGSLLLGCAANLAAPAARANTYQFSFTTTQVLSALQTARTSNGNNDYFESAYFAIFIQPNASQIATYTFNAASLSIPNPTDPNVWQSAVITDPSNPALGYGVTTCTVNCSWAGFYKNSTTQLSFATVLSGNNLGPGGTNIFLGSDWKDVGSTPYAWGGQTYDFNSDTYTTNYDQVINTIMPGSDVFSFSITTSQNLSGTYNFKGYASGLVSGSTTNLTGVKDDGGIAFSLSATVPGEVPEPATWCSLLGGAVLLALLRFKKSRSRGQPDPIASCRD